MPLLKPSQKTAKEQMRIYIDQQLIEQIKAYCEWAEIKKIDEFIEQAAQLVLEKDKDWRKVSKQDGL